MSNTNIPSKYKTRICQQFSVTGSCPYDARCMFAHGDHELRTKEMNIQDGLLTEEAIKGHQRKMRLEAAAAAASVAHKVHRKDVLEAEAKARKDKALAQQAGSPLAPSPAQPGTNQVMTGSSLVAPPARQLLSTPGHPTADPRTPASTLLQAPQLPQVFPLEDLTDTGSDAGSSLQQSPGSGFATPTQSTTDPRFGQPQQQFIVGTPECQVKVVARSSRSTDSPCLGASLSSLPGRASMSTHDLESTSNFGGSTTGIVFTPTQRALQKEKETTAPENPIPHKQPATSNLGPRSPYLNQWQYNRECSCADCQSYLK